METIIIAVLSALIGGGGVAGLIKLFIDPRQEKRKELEAAKSTKRAYRKELSIRVLEHIRIHRADLQTLYTVYSSRFTRTLLPFDRTFLSLWTSKVQVQQKEIANLGSELLLDPDAKEVYNAFIVWANASDAYGNEVIHPKSIFHKTDRQKLKDLDHDIAMKVEALEAAVQAYLSKER